MPVEAYGVVVAALRGGVFRVRLHQTDHIITARCGGRCQRNMISVLVGDSVKLELSACDPSLSRGRIVWRWPVGMPSEAAE
jgi:translation initiation factor IF-1